MKPLRQTSPPAKGNAARNRPAPVPQDQVAARKGHPSIGWVPAVSPRTESRIASLRNGGGEPLSPSLRSYFEPRFGSDLSGVRLHAGGDAAEAAREVRARAFTVGRDVAFGAGEYRPESAEGKRLLAHELAHVVQQAGPAALPARIQRTPAEPGDLHQDLIEQFRRENGFPPHGIDPITGQREGPTDSEIRFGGLLEAWLRQSQAPGGATAPPAPTPTQAPPGRTPAPTPQTPAPTPQTPGQSPAPAPGTTPPPVRGVPAPAQAPSIVGPGTTNVVAACQGVPDFGACRQHQTYVRNILPQTIANIRNVPSPYSAAIAALYTAALPQAQAAAAPVPADPTASPPTFGRSVDAVGGPVTVTIGATPHTFTRFTITLKQFPGPLNGQAWGIGGPIASIDLNEASGDAVQRNLAGIEETMVHETMHIFMEIVEARNAARPTGAVPIEPNLDRASYATVQTGLERALLPFVTQIRQLPSFATRPARGTAAQDATQIARSFLSEAIARAEAGIFVKQRAGQAFTAADLRALPPFIHADAYWLLTPPVAQELTTFLQTNQAAIDAAIQPLVFQAGEAYLNLRP